MYFVLNQIKPRFAETYQNILNICGHGITLQGVVQMT